VVSIAEAGAAAFDYRRYEAILKNHVRTGVTIDGIAVNSVDYASKLRR